MRTESDALGKIKLPKDALYGISTSRSMSYFNIGEYLIPHGFIQVYAKIKHSAAVANYQLKLIDQQTSETIQTVCQEIIDGQHLDAFTLSVWQSGSGTQTNMNVNEVIANRANQLLGHPLGQKAPIHPNDHVNLSHSSNDSFPSCMHIYALQLIEESLQPSLNYLRQTLIQKIKEFSGTKHLARTHLQDALPIDFKMNFQCYLAFVDQTIESLHDISEQLSELPIGGTAVGTGFGAPKNFAKTIISELSKTTQFPLRTSQNPSAAMSQHQALLNFSGVMNNFAACYHKMVNDIRLLGSGPRAGLGELTLPQNELGSSIMPGKVNPTQCESAAMICIHVSAGHNAITTACSFGHFELNTYKPLILHYIHRSCIDLADSIQSFTTHCLKDLSINHKVCDHNISQSLMLVTALRPKIGYDQCAQIATYAYQQDMSLRTAAIELGILNQDELDQLLDLSQFE